MFDPKKYMSNLRGKDYLEVKWRIVWFREAHPEGAITTEILSYDPLIVQAKVFNADLKVLSYGTGSAQAKQGAVWSGREVEKAETAAIGRALAHAGFGTQFSEEESDHLADSPVEKKQEKRQDNKTSKIVWSRLAKDTAMSVANIVEKNAIALLNLSCLDEKSTPDDIRAWYQLYAGFRIENEARDAAELANETWGAE